MVPQTAYLFSGTVASNLRHGRPEATDDEMWDALEVAQAADFVRAMPDGLLATVAQGGTSLSGGQRRRVAIAWALVRRPRSISSTTPSRRSTWGPTPAARRLRATDPRRGGDHRRPAHLDDRRRRSDRRPRRRPRRRDRRPRRAACVLPDLRRDRRVPGADGGCVSTNSDHRGPSPAVAARLPDAARRPRGAVRSATSASTEKAVHFRSSLGRMVAQLRPYRLGLLLVDE